MKYENVVEAVFLERPNRFIAIVSLNGIRERVHVKNTGRCKELLIPGARVALQKGTSPGRKTAYDLISCYKENIGWVNIDSQAPNRIVMDWLQSNPKPFHGITYLKPEFSYGTSRIDFYMECGERKILMEVKGCTLEIDGIGYFPDAPTERGVKHLRELTDAVLQGYACYLTYVITIPGVSVVRPNVRTHPEYAAALSNAEAAGVHVIYLPCEVSKDSVTPYAKNPERK